MSFLPDTGFGVAYMAALSLAGLIAGLFGSRTIQAVAWVLILNWLSTRFCVWWPAPVTVRALADFASLSMLVLIVYHCRSLSAALVALCFAAIMALYVLPKEPMEIFADAFGYLQMLVLGIGSVHGRFVGSGWHVRGYRDSGVHGAGFAHSLRSRLARRA